MRVKNIVFLLSLAAYIFAAGCSCSTWSSFWNKCPERECADHWHWRQKAGTEITAGQPCAAPGTASGIECYPATKLKDKNVIALDRIAPTEITLNESFEYRIRVRNLTDVTLSNVIVTDDLPASFEIMSSTPELGDMKRNTAFWYLGTLEGNATEIITATAVAKSLGPVKSCAQVTYNIPTCTRMDVVESKLHLSREAPEEVLACDRIPVRYVVTNHGNGYACDIEITETLPPGLRSSTGVTEVLFTIDKLGPGESREFTEMMDTEGLGSFTVQAVAKSPIHGMAQSNAVTTRVRKPLLQLNQTCTRSQYIGRNLTYDVTVTNTGDGHAKNAVIETMVPEEMDFVGATQGGTFTRTSPGRIHWNLGTIDPQGSMQVSFELKTEREGTFAARSTVNAYCAEPASDTCQTAFSGVAGILLEVVDVADPITVGDRETYVITVTNQGTSTATNIEISCMLEEKMEYVSSSGPTAGSLIGRTVTFEPLSSLAPKAQASWRVVVKALDDGSVRFRTVMKTDQFPRPVEETEATNFYE